MNDKDLPPRDQRLEWKRASLTSFCKWSAIAIVALAVFSFALPQLLRLGLLVAILGFWAGFGLAALARLEISVFPLAEWPSSSFLFLVLNAAAILFVALWATPLDILDPITVLFGGMPGSFCGWILVEVLISD